MMSSAHFPIDDRDLDDAELWDVIDSAAAARSRRFPLSVKSSSPVSNASSMAPKLFQSAKNYLSTAAAADSRVFPDGEVVQEERWALSRPQKMSRFVEPAARGDYNRMVVVRNPTRTPVVSSPSYPSPFPGKLSAKEVSPIIESTKGSCWLEVEKDKNTHCLSGGFPSVSLFKQYQDAAMAILEKTDYTVIRGNPYIKKSGWRKISFFFNLSFEIRDKTIEYDDNRNVIRAEFLVRAFMQGGRFSDGWGSCERREKQFNKPNHDIPSTAETRAKNKACQDLLGIGEYRPGVKV